MQVSAFALTLFSLVPTLLVSAHTLDRKMPANNHHGKTTTPKFFSYEGFGETQRQNLWYSQAARVGDKIEISGQGGWDPETGILKEDPLEEVDQAFANVDLTLRDAGGEGWSQVYKVVIYALEPQFVDEAFLGRIIENFKKWMPDHQPLLTAVGVAKLGAGIVSHMKIEVEVVAYDP
ncbi:hypothetical protein OQA88_1132 [Cercophora sp. LCS_1]